MHHETHICWFPAYARSSYQMSRSVALLSHNPRRSRTRVPPNQLFQTRDPNAVGLAITENLLSGRPKFLSPEQLVNFSHQ
jgi:hypothetical protein